MLSLDVALSLALIVKLFLIYSDSELLFLINRDFYKLYLFRKKRVLETLLGSRSKVVIFGSEQF